ncbi:MAG: GAF domain-containing protein [Chloroflexota bacterium]|nr:GAF domain-containing protein [Chloroflexota bacterium]
MTSRTGRDRLEVGEERGAAIAGVDGSLLGYERSLLEVLFDRVPMGIAIFDRGARLLRCNPTWADFIEQYTPTPANQVVAGASLSDLAPGMEVRFEPVLERVLAGETVRLESVRSESGGIVSYWDVVFAPLVDDGEVVGFIDVTIDATDRELSHRTLERRVERRTRELRQRRRVAEGLRDILSVLNSDRPRGEILSYIVEEASHLLGADGGVIYHLDQERGSVTVEASHGLPEELAALKASSLPEPWSDDPLFSRTPVAVPNLSTYLSGGAQGVQIRRWLDVIRGHYQAYLAVPLVIKDQMYGTLGGCYREPQTFSDEEIELAVALGDQAALAIENARLRTQASQVAVVAERERLARELHDSVTQSLYSLTLLAEASHRLVETGDLGHVREYTGRLGEIAQQALREMRLLVYQLRPLVLKREGLAGALQQRLDAVEKRAGLDARLLVQGSIELPAEVEEGLYRIAQEALNNALKHAAPTSVTVRIQIEAEEVMLEVGDDGRGFDPQDVKDKGGMGLVNMRERAERLGGSFTLDSTPGEGTTVRVSLGVT